MSAKNIPIDVICKFEGQPCDAPIPIKFRFTRQDGTRITVQVDQIKDIEHDFPMSNHTIKYRCLTIQDSRQIEYELRYFAKTFQWQLYQFLR